MTENLDWLRGRLETVHKYESDKHMTTKQSINRRALRENMITGKETTDSDGFKFSEWEGVFEVLTGRKPTDMEFMEYSDWLDSHNKEVPLSIYDNLKIWFDKRDIPMLPKLRDNKKVTNEDMEKRIYEVMEKINIIRDTQ